MKCVLNIALGFFCVLMLGTTKLSAQTAAVAGPNAEQVLAEINLARADPPAYAAYLVELRPRFKGNMFSRPGLPTLATNEGVAAVDEAIAYLKTTKPLPPVKLASGMCRSAGDHVTDVVKNKQDGHRGSDGSLPEDRLGRYGQVTGNGALAENIAYDAQTARDVVIGFIIDDGFASRGHRLNIFSPTFSVIGVGVEPLAGSNSCCVVTFAEGYAEKQITPARP